jgi:hypothetical protein
VRKLAGLMLVAAGFVLQAIPASAAYEAYIVVKGTKQGQVKGEVMQSPPAVQPELQFTYAAQSPRDIATGQASGKRQWKPVKVIKEWGSASPQLGQAELLCRALVVRVSVAGAPAAQALPIVRGGSDNACWYQVMLPGPKAVRGQVWLALPGNDFAVTGNSILVDFLEGDPDRPIVIGATFNGQDAAGRYRLAFTHSAMALPPAVPTRPR